MKETEKKITGRKCPNVPQQWNLLLQCQVWIPSSWLVGQRYSTENFQTFQGTAKVTGYALQMVKPYYWTLTHHRALTSQAGVKLQPSPYSLVFLCPLPQGKASHQSAENPDVIYCENNQLTTLIGCKPTPWNGAHAWHCWSGQEPQKPMDLGENCSTVLLLCWRSTAIKWLNILLHLQTSVSLSHHQRSPLYSGCVLTEHPTTGNVQRLWNTGS